MLRLFLAGVLSLPSTLATENRTEIKLGGEEINDTDHDGENISETLAASRSCSTTHSVEKVSV